MDLARQLLTPPTRAHLPASDLLSNSFFSPFSHPPRFLCQEGESVVQQFKRKLIHPALKTVAEAWLLCADLSEAIEMVQH